jgi:hypothetical protein
MTQMKFPLSNMENQIALCLCYELKSQGFSIISIDDLCERNFDFYADGIGSPLMMIGISYVKEDLEVLLLNLIASIDEKPDNNLPDINLN